MRHHALLTALLALTLFPSCIKEPERTYEFDFKSAEGAVFEEFNLPVSDIQLQILIVSNCDWEIIVPEATGEWLSFSQTQGDGDASVVMTAKGNGTADIREGTFDVRISNAGHRTYRVNQKCNQGYFSVTADKTKIVDCGETVTISVDTNLGDWEYSVDGEELTEVSKTSGELVLSLGGPLVTDGDRNLTVSFSSPSHPDCSETWPVTVKSALTLDLAPLKDGSVTNVSAFNIPVTTVEGMGMTAGGTLHFLHAPGSTQSEGYVKVDYVTNRRLREALLDGHSMEAQFMPGADNDASKDICVMSAMQSGGMGIILPAGSGDICWWVSVSPNGVSRWCKVSSGVVPRKGEYYHVVGIWDKAAGKALLYVNGELKGSSDASGELVQPATNDYKWLCVGGDTAKDAAESAFNGDVALARVYDAVLDESAVKALWDEAGKDFGKSVTDIQDVLYLPECNVSAGSMIPVSATGLRDGDGIRLESLDRSASMDCSATVSGGRLNCTVPANLTSGRWMMMLTRDGGAAPLGIVGFTVSPDAAPIHRPMTIAHRGAHGTGIPENSIAALAKAQEIGCFGSETDCWISTDGEIFINHDGVIGGKKIQNCSSADLAGVTLANGEKLPTFSEYLAQAGKGSTKLIIEIKQHSTEQQDFDCVDKVMDIVKAEGMCDRVEWISFSYPVCKRVAAALPGAKVGYLQHDRTPADVLADGITSIDYSFDYMFAYPGLFDQAHSLGMIVNVWTVDKDMDLLKSIGLGADYITTNEAARLLEIADRLFD